MRIKTLLFFNVIISVITLFLIGMVIYWSIQQEEEARNNELMANSIVKDVNELRGLAFDYSMHKEERIVVQWKLKIDQLKKMAGVEFETPEQNEILYRIRSNLQDVESTFFELAAIRAKAGDIAKYQQQEDRYTSILLLKMQLIVLDAFKLSDESNMVLEIANRSHRIIVIVLIVLSTVTISVSILIIRSITRPLSRLQEGIEIIGSGNMDHRVDIRSFDEIGMLSDAFNEMAIKLKERTSHLESAIMELESFAFSASHDLRTPLRSIDGYSQAILEDYGDKLDDTGREYLNRARIAAQKMSDIIDAMLNMSQITRNEMHIRNVNLSVLAATIAEKLRKSRPDRKVEFIIAEGLTASGDPDMLEIVLDNLLGNAWKFTGKHPDARIEFGATIAGGRTAYFVRDDGAGFDMAYVDKLFKPFERQHTEADFPGIGTGLATVRRIIDRHGGEVWGEGAIEKGATFYFTLPGGLINER